MYIEGSTGLGAGVLAEPDDFKVSTRNYTDPGIFEMEMRNIYGKVWVYIGHDSEVPLPGDYKTAAIGRTPVILSRGKEGELNVVLNACRHRANAVCREERGNSMHFQCPYHGWTYKNSGELIGVTMRDGYPETFDPGTAGLIRIPRVASYRGLIFASLNKDIESLEDYLGPIKSYVDDWADQSLVGEVRVLPAHKYAYNGNWKFQAENGSDGYHANFVHQSAFKTFAHFNLAKYRDRNVRRNSNEDLGYTFGTDVGHGVLGNTLAPGDTAQGLAKLTQDVFDEYFAALSAKHGPERARQICGSRHVFIFPNVFLMDVNIRVIQPLAPDKTAVYSHFINIQGGTDELNSQRMLDLQRRLGTVGMVGSDDVEMFAANQSGMEGSVGGLDWIFFTRGIDKERPVETGGRLGGSSSETPQRAFHLGWQRYMG